MKIQVPDVDPIVDLISLVLHSGGLPGRRPLSVLLCAPSGNGKTRITDRFENGPGIHRSGFMTRSGLVYLLREHDRWKTLHHIILTDFTSSMAGTSETGLALQTIIMLMIYDGLSDYNTSFIRGLHLPPGVSIKVGIIAGVVPSIIRRRRLEWEENGFLRRFLPVSYRYTSEQMKGVKVLSLQGRNVNYPSVSLNTQLWGENITVSDQLINPFIPLTEGESTADQQIRSLVLAHALRRGSTKVEDQDVERVMRLSKYITYNMPELKSQTLELPDD